MKLYRSKPVEASEPLGAANAAEVAEWINANGARAELPEAEGAPWLLMLYSPGEMPAYEDERIVKGLDGWRIYDDRVFEEKFEPA